MSTWSRFGHRKVCTGISTRLSQKVKGNKRIPWSVIPLILSSGLEDLWLNHLPLTMDYRSPAAGWRLVWTKWITCRWHLFSDLPMHSSVRRLFFSSFSLLEKWWSAEDFFYRAKKSTAITRGWMLRADNFKFNTDLWRRWQSVIWTDYWIKWKIALLLFLQIKIRCVFER